MTMPALLEIAEQAATDVREGFTNPGDDWPGMLLLRTSKKGKVLLIVFADGLRGDKNEQASAIAGILRQHHAAEAALILSSWGVCSKIDDGGLVDYIENNPRPSQHPEREEVLAFTYVTRSAASMGVARIERHTDRPPTLGPLEIEGEGPEIGGRYVDAMRLAINE